MKNSKTTIQLCDNDCLKIQGDLVFSGVAQLERRFFRILNRQNQIKVDLKAVNMVDSAGLALLITWKRLAQDKKIKLKFENIPSALQKIADLNEVSDLIV